MTKRLAAVLLACLMMVLTITTLAEEVQVPTAVGETPVRVAADGMSEIMATIPDGSTLNVLEVLGDWVAVSVAEGNGYVHISNVAGMQKPETPETPDTETPAPQMKVTIFTSRRTVMTPGETVTLTSLLEGFDGYTVAYQWQCDQGAGFQDVPGATGDSYSFPADLESLSWSWMLLVTAYPIG